MTTNGRQRIFTAIEPPEEILKKIQHIQLRLRKIIHGPVNWVRPEGIHLTLKFFGEVAGDVLATISERLEGFARQAKPLKLEVRKIGAFPNLNNPRVVWIGIEGDIAPLSRLQQTIDEGFGDLGYPGEERPFRPHLTLGRIKEPKVLLGLAGIVEAKEVYDAGGFEAGGLDVIKSDLTPQGARYTRLGHFAFTRE